MKNIPVQIQSILLVVAVGFGLSSCKEDDPPVKPKLSFADTEITVNEDAGNVEVELVLDKPHSKDLRIEYSLGGTASDQDQVGTANADYKISRDHGVVKIEAGETSGFIEIEITADSNFEPDETIEIAIVDTNTDEIELTEDDKTIVTIKNDDAQIVASFTTTALTFNEAEGLAVQGGNVVAVPVNIPINLDKASSNDIAVAFEVTINLSDPNTNHAIDSTWADANEIPGRYFDYYIRGTTSTTTGVTGEVVIPKGSTTANLEIFLITDFMWEDPETIEITLKESAAVKVGTNQKTTVTIEEQDGKAIVLVWDEYTDVDMDMFLWLGEDTTNLTMFLPLAITPSVTRREEIIFLPNLFAEGAFGLSYIYYEGSADPMDFAVLFIDFEDGESEPEDDWDIFQASYTQANVNPWDIEAGTYPPAVVHRFIVTNGVYAFGKVQVPATGSRVRPTEIPKPTRMTDIGKSRTGLRVPFRAYTPR